MAYYIYSRLFFYTKLVRQRSDRVIYIYDKKTTKGNFETNGLGVLDEVISCFITEELNGDYELELEYSAKEGR
ncbi:hypothetical protein K144316041_18040 [Clostridium tetani]|nr:hypothetical protein K144312032_19320 [Clostridium tetani]BDR73096.1 hypothetical protein K144316041_18040 [Clostridium tetani]